MPVTEVTHSMRTVLTARRGPWCGGARSAARPARSWAGHSPHHYAAHLGYPPLRTGNGHNRDERRASWLELFFDLAFVGAVGQLAGAFQNQPGLGLDHGASGAGR